MYKIEGKNQLQHPVLKDSWVVLKEVCERKKIHLSGDIVLPQYSSFTKVPVADLVKLRILQEQEGYALVVEQYTNKLFRFSEINLWQYSKKLNSKSLSFADKMLFHQLLINFFIHSFLLTNDFRFLNTALKLDSSKGISFSASLFLQSVNKPVLRLFEINNAFLQEATRV